MFYDTLKYSLKVSLMHTQLHNKTQVGFKPNRMAKFQLGDVPGIGVVAGTVDGTKNLAKTWLGYAPTQIGLGLKKGIWDLFARDMIWENGVKNWGAIDLLSLGITKAGKILGGGIGNLIDPTRSVIHHTLGATAGTATYTAGSFAQPALGLVAGHHLKFEVPVAAALTNAANKTVAGTKKLAGKMQGSGGGTPAAPAAAPAAAA